MNNNEPIVLGKVKKGSGGKPIVIIIVFLFIGGIILFLPSIISYFDDYSIIDLVKNGEIIDFFVNHDSYVNKPIENNKTDNKEEKEDKVLINSKATLSKNDIILNNFLIKNESIKFNITTNKTINLDEQNYYLIISKNNKILSTIKLTGIINKTTEYNFKFLEPLNDLVGVEGAIEILKDNDYPSFIVSSDESGLASLTCEKDNYKIEYILNNNQLIRIKETFSYIDEGNSDEYIEKFEEYSKLSTEINNSNGTSSLTENYTGFTYTTDIDLNIYNPKKINYNYYSLNTKTNKINFEMTAKGYDCK